MAISTVYLAATGTAAIIAATQSNRKQLLIRNSGPSSIFIGTSAVTAVAGDTNSGYPILVGDVMMINDVTVNLYAICTSGSTATATSWQEYF